MNQDFNFPRRQRINLKRDYDMIFSKGKRFSDSNLLVYVLSTELGYPRLGLAVGKKHGNAVKRNRLKRLIREAFRLNKEQLPESADIVVVPRKTVEVELESLTESLVRLANTGKGSGD